MGLAGLIKDFALLPANRRAMRVDQFYADDQDMQPGPNAGPIEQAYFAHEGRLIHKWHHYLPIYDRHFAPFIARAQRGEPIRFLEIGVSHGGSLALWRKIFGPTAAITGIDINPKCAAFDGDNGCRVRIGSQTDTRFLNTVVDEMGGLDIVLDDGSHVGRHMIFSFNVLFPRLADSGLYVAEDVCCAYWTKFGGGYGRSDTFIGLTGRLIDDIHHWWHRRGQKVSAARDRVAAVHVYDSVVVIDKAPVPRPVNSRLGAPSF